MRRFFCWTLLALLVGTFAVETVDAGRRCRRCRVRTHGHASVEIGHEPNVRVFSGGEWLPPARPLYGPDGEPIGDGIKLLAMHNATRHESGLAALVLDAQLCMDAMRSANEQRLRGRCGHFTPLRAGAENCAAGHQSPLDAVNGWLASPGHAANIRGAWTRIGFGRDGDFWAVRFAR